MRAGCELDSSVCLLIPAHRIAQEESEAEATIIENVGSRHSLYTVECELETEAVLFLEEAAASPSSTTPLVRTYGCRRKERLSTVETRSTLTSNNDEASEESAQRTRFITFPAAAEIANPLTGIQKDDDCQREQLPFVRAMLMATRAKEAGVRTVLRLRAKPPLCFLIVNRAYHQFGLKHLVLILIFIFYVLLGAMILLFIEQPAQATKKDAWRAQLEKNRTVVVSSLLKGVFNNSNYLIYIKGGTTLRLQHHFNEVFQEYEKNLGVRWSDQRMEWDYWNAILFAGTVCTTIGYGHIYPMTAAGRVITMIYALIGIPLMLLVLQDIGKLLTISLKFPWFQFKRIMRRILKCCTKQSLKEMRRIEAQERLDLEVFDLPLPVGVALIVIWVWICTIVLSLWDSNWSLLEAFYFFFISLSTVGLGDLVPSNPQLLIMLFGFILIGLSLVSMVINLLQSKMRTTYEAGAVTETTTDATTLGVLQAFEDRETRYLLAPDEMHSSTHSRQTQTSLSLPGTRHCVLRSDGVHWLEDTSPMKSPDEVTRLVELESSLDVCRDIGENNEDCVSRSVSFASGGSSQLRAHMQAIRDDICGRHSTSSLSDGEGTAHHSSPGLQHGLLLELSQEDLPVATRTSITTPEIHNIAQPSSLYLQEATQCFEPAFEQ